MSDLWTPEDGAPVSNSGGLGDLAFVNYEDLLAALATDFQVDATGLLPGTVTASLESDSSTTGLGTAEWRAWQPVTLTGSWAASVPVGYLKDPLGFVHLRGRLTGGANSSIAFTLPPGYRPAENYMHAAAGYDGAGAVAGAAFAYILTTGDVLLYFAAGAGDIGLGIPPFLAEN